MPDKVTDKLTQAKIITDQVKVLTPDAIDRIIDQDVTTPIEIAEQSWSVFSRIKSMFRKKKKRHKCIFVFLF